MIVPFLFLATQPQEDPAPPGYHLAWSDEFNRDGAPDPANWHFEQGFVRNRELQWYQPQNATVRHGSLVIEGRRERVPNPNYDPASSDWQKNRQYADYTSACVETRGLHEWLYGRFEVRARISAQPGLWPAIWTLGVSKPWPSNGEVDILEYYQNMILANTAYGVGGGTWHTVKTPYDQIATDKDWDRKFHVWRMDWDENWIRLYLDDRLLNETDVSKTVNPDGFNPFHQPQFLLLNLAIGSTGGDPSKTRFPTKYEIDYVRVYQQDG
jgi:beta-glucanase (GH16 family)